MNQDAAAHRPGVADRPRLLAAALGYARRGMPVHPLRLGEKEPRWLAWQRRATCDETEVRRLWERAPYNVGVMTGNGLVVIDLDQPKPGVVYREHAATPGARDGRDALRMLIEAAGAAWPQTMTVTTASGGAHLYFATDPDIEVRSSVRRIGQHIDVRAAGGYVVGIGSEVGGHRYVLQPGPTEPAPMPQWLLDLCLAQHDEHQEHADPAPAPSAPVFAPSSNRARAWAVGTLQGMANDLARMAPGTGRDTELYKKSSRGHRLVVAGLVTEAEVEEAMLWAAGSCGLTAEHGELRVRASIRSGMASRRGQAPLHPPASA
ncbi:bifunctional DNA primase/polymerase [Streptomyces albireticuli]|uniref:DNA primase/polymerase bifunctional N-terminal domain-containing protein n=1 Tax=Streptomyces albireticuli TaxID=1940 RepID=A0A2A2D1S3_9ACTN|nr:bifunctional DNA primase/polymerase [Streptomyces albireticuli]MCD9145889.1 bifunctional DNA primase/polymerase [Streptomyces albireticuli]MCD9166103.1 bifunctional DNA primase/polymerase [Streptomyces albireticuli]MCD9196383.1 bifunctional DNA primase/polymerase [Streptomyces albireticuli]PAU45290.1 hypothetical protein CK936_30215 [Streptomyces albireticuli]